MIATSPPIAAGQTEASVTVSGIDPKDLEMLIATPPEKRKLSGGDCVRLSLGAVRKLQRETAEESARADELFGVTPEEKHERDADVIVKFTETMIACLDLVKRAEALSRPAAVSTRSLCKLSTVTVRVRIDRAAQTVRYRSRRASRRSPSRRLRVSCRRAPAGGLTVRVGTRSRRVKLRKVIGRRLVVGAYRSAGPKGEANEQTTFKRR